MRRAPACGGARNVRASRGGAATLPAVFCLAAAALLLTSGCGKEKAARPGGMQVIATTSVLADLAQNVAGTRFTVQTLIPRDADPHAFEPTPGDLRRIAEADLVIVNGAGLEGTLAKYLTDLGKGTMVVASRGLEPRTPKPGEAASDYGGETDPHFWLDPLLAKSYVDTIAAAFAAQDPGQARQYARGAASYKKRLDALDDWIAAQVATVPAERRKLVMNHASHGYWADRYGFRIVGAVIPSVSTGAAPTAADLADLLETIEREDVPVIFVEVEESPKLPEQIAADAGIRVVDDLLDHSLTGPNGAAPTYIRMMEYDTTRIVKALQP